MIEAAYKLAPLNVNSWKTLVGACHIYFVTNIVPIFINLDNLPSEDRTILLTGNNSNVSHLFKVSQCLKIQESETQGAPRWFPVQFKKEDMCPLQNQVSLRNNLPLISS